MNDRIDLIAPCGILCGTCMKYLERVLPASTTKSGPCIGCRQRNKTCAFLKKGCPYLPNRQVTFCFECPEFPCERLLRLDATYQRDYAGAAGLGTRAFSEAANWSEQPHYG